MTTEDPFKPHFDAMRKGYQELVSNGLEPTYDGAPREHPVEMTTTYLGPVLPDPRDARIRELEEAVRALVKALVDRRDRDELPTRAAYESENAVDANAIASAALDAARKTK